MNYYCLLFIPVLLLTGCSSPEAPTAESVKTGSVFLTVLGNVQDAGSPHIACKKNCCRALFDAPDPERQVTSLGLVDDIARRKYLFEASPDMPRQVKALHEIAGNNRELPDGIFLTHAHIGHYTGLMYLGKEATNAAAVPVYAMPRMDSFLRTNGPWSQLVTAANINLQRLRADSTISLTEQLAVAPFTVPHRDEFSETVGYRIVGPEKTAIFLPDIDKWSRWDRRIEDVIAETDYAFVDGTFFDGAELDTRDISQIPHPFVSESISRFSEMPARERRKIIFIHFNHTNRLLLTDSKETAAVRAAGMRVARYGEVFPL